MAQVFVTGGSGFVGRNLIRALVQRGDTVRALARSERSAATVAALGAQPVRGDLTDTSALAEGVSGADVVFHSAACVEDWGPREMFHEANVVGTRNVARAAGEAGVGALVHVSTEAVLAGRRTIRDADETWPLAPDPIALTKGRAGRVVLDESRRDMRVVIVRPRLVWGAGDTSLLPNFVQLIEQGQYSWIAGGRYLTSTCHVRNLIEGMLLAAERGADRRVYFLTDGPPVEFRGFITALVETQGLDPGDRSVPRWLARIASGVVEALWRALPLKGRPPLTRAGLRIVGEEVTVNDGRARAELGYRAAVTLEEGLAEMRAAHGAGG